MNSVLTRQSGLLGAVEFGQLREWLGDEGATLTRIFKKMPGRGSREFHAAVDSRGATITVVEVLAGQAFNHTKRLFDNERQIIGAYNPQSWHSRGGWNFTLVSEQRSAFLFNLTSGEVQRQNAAGEGLNQSGIYQTYNTTDRGPTFGGGYDLYIDATLDYGEVYNYSFGGTSLSRNILIGPEHHHSGRMFGELEVWRVITTPRG